MLIREKKVRQNSEGLFTLCTEKTLDLAYLLNSIRDKLAFAGTMSLYFSAAAGTNGDLILCRLV
jgi:hypothetical protein